MIAEQVLATLESRVAVFRDFVARIRSDVEALRADLAGGREATKSEVEWLLGAVAGLAADLHRAEGALAPYALAKDAKVYRDVVIPDYMGTGKSATSTQWVGLHRPAQLYFADATEKRSAVAVHTKANSSNYVAPLSARAN